MVDPYSALNTDFMSTVDVVCPKCGDRAFVLNNRPGPGARGRKKNIHFSCPGCGYAVIYSNTPKFRARDHMPGMRAVAHLPLVNPDYDPFFGFELWYRKETVYGLLWAYNLGHLEVMENYIADRHNDTDRDSPLLNHLTPWMKDINNGEYLLIVIQKLKQK